MWAAAGGQVVQGLGGCGQEFGFLLKVRGATEWFRSTLKSGEWTGWGMRVCGGAGGGRAHLRRQEQCELSYPPTLVSRGPCSEHYFLSQTKSLKSWCKSTPQGGESAP